MRLEAGKEGMLPILGSRERNALREYARSVIRDEHRVELPPDRVRKRVAEEEDAGVEGGGA